MVYLINENVMTIHPFSAKQVAAELRRSEITPKSKQHYLILSFVIFTVFYYSGLIIGQPTWTWMSVYEGVAVLVIQVFGVAKAYEASGSEENSDFIAEFTCLYVPVSITTVGAIWTCFWIIMFVFRETIIGFAETNHQLAINLASIGGDVANLFTFLSNILVQIVIYRRIAKHLGNIRRER